jgi:signal transduction histidine kinase
MQCFLIELTGASIYDSIISMHNLPLEPNDAVNDAKAPHRGAEDPVAESLLATLIDVNRDGILAFNSELRLRVINRQALHYLNLPGNPEDWHDRDLAELAAELHLYAPEAVDPLRAELERLGNGDESRGAGEFCTGYEAIRWLNLPIDLSLAFPTEATSSGRLVILSAVTSQYESRLKTQDLMRCWMDELQAPLRHVTEALRQVASRSGEALPEASRQALVSAVGEAESMLATVRRLVDFNRLDNGQMPLSISAFSLVDVVERILGNAQPSARKKALKLEHSIAGDLPLTWGDKGLIERIFADLVFRVLDAASPGGTIQVEAEVLLADHGRILVSITDRDGAWAGSGAETGTVGVRELSPPYSAGQPTRDLNLAFCHKVLEAHGERLWVSDSPWARAVLRFTLPQVSESLDGV